MTVIHGLILFVQALTIGILWRQRRALQWIVEHLEERSGAAVPGDITDGL